MACQKIFKFTLYIYIFWETKQIFFKIEPKSYTAMLIYFFSIFHCLLVKKNGN